MEHENEDNSTCEIEITDRMIEAGTSRLGGGRSDGVSTMRLIN